MRGIKKKYRQYSVSNQGKKWSGHFSLDGGKEIQRGNNLSQVFKDDLLLNEGKVQVVEGRGRTSPVAQHPGA